jgi:TM2 domain-containing membrane protein YozV
MKSRITAAILALLLGGIGVHRFYLGQTGLGVLYLLFFWTFIPAIVAFIDFVIWITMTDDKFNEKYNAGISLPASTSSANTIEKLYDLKEKGIITDAEFQDQKGRLLK